MPIDDTDQFEKKQKEEIRQINYIPEAIRKNVGGFKDKIVRFFYIITTKQAKYGRKDKAKTQNKSYNIENPFIIK